MYLPTASKGIISVWGGSFNGSSGFRVGKVARYGDVHLLVLVKTPYLRAKLRVCLLALLAATHSIPR